MLGFYTRLPVVFRGGEARAFADSQWAAPLAGAVVGLICGVGLWVSVLLGLPATVAAALALALGVALTGALHEDGLADTADGFGGGRSREEKLAIMRDSRSGAFGVVAICLSLLIRWAALAARAMSAQARRLPRSPSASPHSCPAAPPSRSPQLSCSASPRSPLRGWRGARSAARPATSSAQRNSLARSPCSSRPALSSFRDRPAP
jgi:adenosylcobinamide-GDP ribazoletransferase